MSSDWRQHIVTTRPAPPESNWYGSPHAIRQPVSAGSGRNDTTVPGPAQGCDDGGGEARDTACDTQLDSSARRAEAIRTARMHAIAQMFQPKEETMSTYKRFFTLFNDASKDPHWPYENHGELVREYTQGKTDSLRKLNDTEVRALERRLEQMAANPRLEAAQRMRRKIIGILAGRGAVTTQGKPDMARIYAWVMRYGYLKKDLNAYTVQELPKLVFQAESVLASDLKAILAHHG